MSDRTSLLDYSGGLFSWLDLLIQREIRQVGRVTLPPAESKFRGLYISEAEVIHLLSNPTPPGPAENEEDNELTLALEKAEQRLAILNKKRERPLPRLARLFGLNEIEQAALLVCLAPEYDLKYERIFAFLQNDLNQKRPTQDLILRLAVPAAERLAARSAFGTASPLFKWKLVNPIETEGTHQNGWLNRSLQLDPRIAAYLLGVDYPDARLNPLQDDQASKAGQLTAETRQQLSDWARAWPKAWPGAGPVVVFHGRYGTGKEAAAERLAAELGQPLLAFQATSMVSSEFFRLAEREARLRGAILAFYDAGKLLAGAEGSESGQPFLQELAGGEVPVILTADHSWEPANRLGARPYLRLEMPETSYSQRQTAWADSLGELALSAAELTALTGRYRLTVGQIQDALQRARSLAWASNPNDPRLTLDQLEAASRMQSQQHLGTLARKLRPRYTWRDIVLPAAQMTTLRLICTMVRHRPTVYGEWGFDRKLAMGKGVISLFAGPSGTGKTMAAEIIACELGLDLYKIDLSAVVNKYIGETEKNLERIFTEVQDSDAILFFDEADALFGKRSEVKDAHDRYANIETAYLLQRIEEYSGLVILASNLKKNMDEAFLRRLHFAIDFPLPDEPERLEIWRRTFPNEAPRANDLDLPFLARKLKLTGGNIRNIILAAAFLAAENGGKIGMAHLVGAAGYELQKMGKLLNEEDFERYFNLIQL